MLKVSSFFFSPFATEPPGALVSLADAHLETAALRFKHGKRIWSLAKMKRDMRAHDAAHGDTVTPYGRVVQRLELPSGDGDTPISFAFVSPFAFLYSACAGSAAFARLVAQCIRGEATHATIAIYLDDTRPGNPMRPGPARSYYAIYWMFIELPEWFRVGPHGYFPLCFAERKDLLNIEGYVSRIVAVVFLAMFHPTEFNMERLGMDIPMGEAGPGEAAPTTWIRAKFGAFIGDEKALAELVSGKGASGTRLCPSCQNIVGRCARAKALPGRLRHWTCGDVSQWIPHSAQSMAELADHVAAHVHVLARVWVCMRACVRA